MVSKGFRKAVKFPSWIWNCALATQWFSCTFNIQNVLGWHFYIVHFFGGHASKSPLPQCLKFAHPREFLHVMGVWDNVEILVKFSSLVFPNAANICLNMNRVTEVTVHQFNHKSQLVLTKDITHQEKIKEKINSGFIKHYFNLLQPVSLVNEYLCFLISINYRQNWNIIYPEIFRKAILTVLTYVSSLNLCKQVPYQKYAALAEQGSM